MIKKEFEDLTMRCGGGEINQELYNVIQGFYMSDSDYHQQTSRQGAYEDKQSFCKRVFGGKVNTPKTILRKIIAEAIKGNIYAVGSFTDKATLDQYAALIAEHYTAISKW